MIVCENLKVILCEGLIIVCYLVKDFKGINDPFVFYSELKRNSTKCQSFEINDFFYFAIN